MFFSFLITYDECTILYVEMHYKKHVKGISAANSSYFEKKSYRKTYKLAFPKNFIIHNKKERESGHTALESLKDYLKH